MVATAKISWGSYQAYSGPFYWGKHRWSLPAEHDDMDELVFIMSSAEGCLDSMNLYDRCILSGGAIGWCDAYPQLSYTKLLGLVAEKHPDPGYLQRTLKPALDASGASFKKNAAGQWRFFIGAREVSSQELQRELYFAGSSGKTGDWSETQKARAKLWAACCATVFEDVHAQKIQIDYTKPKMMGFVTAYAKSILFDDDDPTLSTADAKLVKSLRGIYVSFAGNNPTWANAAIKNAAARSKHAKWSRAWCIDALHDLTFLKGIKIYPERYEKVVGVTEKLYAAGLPNHANELKTAATVAAPEPDPVVPATVVETTSPPIESTSPDVVAPIETPEVQENPTSNDEATIDATTDDGQTRAETAAIERAESAPATPLARIIAFVTMLVKLIMKVVSQRR